MKSQIIVGIYGISLLILVGLGIKYVQSKGSEIDEFCSELTQISNMIDIGSSVQIINELNEALTYKMIFCLNQSTPVSKEGQYIIVITSDSISQQLSNYKNQNSAYIANSFAHLYKRN